jgi:hypothetical protein
MNNENKYTFSNIAKNIVDFIKYIPTIPYTNSDIPKPDTQKSHFTNEVFETPTIKEDIPTIEFMRGSMGGFCFSDNTPAKFGGWGVPIPEHKELYEKCEKEELKFYWTTSPVKK